MRMKCQRHLWNMHGKLVKTGDFFYDRSMSDSEIEEDCNLKCEQMVSKGRLCGLEHQSGAISMLFDAFSGHCWTLTTNHCDFYHLPEELLVSSPPIPVADLCWNHSAQVNIYPTVTPESNGRTSYFPLMKRFVHTTQSTSRLLMCSKELGSKVRITSLHRPMERPKASCKGSTSGLKSR